jgi:hypothetical protein
MERQGKEYKIQANEDINIELGTVDRRKPNIIYINIRLWIQKMNGESKPLSNIFHNFNKQIFSFIKEIGLSEKYIIDYDISNEAVELEKPTFLNIQALFRQKDTILDLLSFKDTNQQHVINLVSSLSSILNEYGYVYSKKRW